jgi:hypothetical protein
MPLEIALVVEDVLSLTVMERLLAHTGRGYVVARPMVEHGIGNIRRSIEKYRNSSRALAHVVLADLDQGDCAPVLRAQWGVATLPDTMLFRVAVREVEAWLLADMGGFSAFAGIPSSKIPRAPETLADPKQTLINLVRRSRNRRLVAEIVPAQGSRMSIGPMYNERLSNFVRASWDVDAALELAPSLKRTLDRLHTFLR